MWKYLTYGISEQYADDIVTYHFLNVFSDLIYDNGILSIEKPQIFCFAFALIMVNSIIFD